jgi:hypothetical protein
LQVRVQVQCMCMCMHQAKHMCRVRACVYVHAL